MEARRPGWLKEYATDGGAISRSRRSGGRVRRKSLASGRQSRTCPPQGDVEAAHSDRRSPWDGSVDTTRSSSKPNGTVPADGALKPHSAGDLLTHLAPWPTRRRDGRVGRFPPDMAARELWRIWAVVVTLPPSSEQYLSHRDGERQSTSSRPSRVFGTSIKLPTRPLKSGTRGNPERPHPAAGGRFAVRTRQPGGAGEARSGLPARNDHRPFLHRETSNSRRRTSCSCRTTCRS